MPMRGHVGRGCQRRREMNCLVAVQRRLAPEVRSDGRGHRGVPAEPPLQRGQRGPRGDHAAAGARRRPGSAAREGALSLRAQGRKVQTEVRDPRDAISLKNLQDAGGCGREARRGRRPQDVPVQVQEDAGNGREVERLDGRPARAGHVKPGAVLGSEAQPQRAQLQATVNAKRLCPCCACSRVLLAGREEALARLRLEDVGLCSLAGVEGVEPARGRTRRACGCLAARLGLHAVFRDPAAEPRPGSTRIRSWPHRLHVAAEAVQVTPQERGELRPAAVSQVDGDLGLLLGDKVRAADAGGRRRRPGVRAMAGAFGL
mmetsp:Transcript_110437/g.330330  ORF Transcript_110437/g.330330 Transcript_110437/m.330330 type:complete len:316 (-) Transcript_110437:409-1356(-)